MLIDVKLKEVRKNKGLTQMDLAVKMGMSLFTIQQIENNRAKSITFNTLSKICSVLDCEPGDLLKLEKQ
jgi:putative transcriptional regulator